MLIIPKITPQIVDAEIERLRAAAPKPWTAEVEKKLREALVPSYLRASYRFALLRRDAEIRRRQIEDDVNDRLQNSVETFHFRERMRAFKQNPEVVDADYEMESAVDDAREKSPAEQRMLIAAARRRFQLRVKDLPEYVALQAAGRERNRLMETLTAAANQELAPVFEAAERARVRRDAADKRMCDAAGVPVKIQRIEPQKPSAAQGLGGLG